MYSEENQWRFGIFWIFIQWKVISGTDIDIYPTKLPNCEFCEFWSYTYKNLIKAWKKIQGKIPGLSQQSTLAGNSEPIQFEIPQTKSPMQSSFVSQSPSLNVHGLAIEQQDHTFSQSVHWIKISLRIFSNKVLQPNTFQFLQN